MDIHFDKLNDEFEPSEKLRKYIKEFFGKNVVVRLKNGKVVSGIFENYQRPADNEDICWSIDILDKNKISLVYILDTEIESMKELNTN